MRSRIEAGISRESLQQLLPPGGARNGVDCALWDLEAKLLGKPVWQLAGLADPKPLITTMTCGAESPDAMAEAAYAYKGFASTAKSFPSRCAVALLTRFIADGNPAIASRLSYRAGWNSRRSTLSILTWWPCCMGPLVLFAVSDDTPKVTRGQLLSTKQQGAGSAEWRAETADGSLRLVPFWAVKDETCFTYLAV